MFSQQISQLISYGMCTDRSRDSPYYSPTLMLPTLAGRTFPGKNVARSSCYKITFPGTKLILTD